MLHIYNKGILCYKGVFRMQYYNYQDNRSIESDLSKAINGEYSAIQCYEKIANLAPTNEIRNQILEIRNDEIRHYNSFSQIFQSLTGTQPKPQILETCPNNYRDGIHSAFIDEQRTVDLYHEIARQTKDNYIKEQFQQAAADEQNHAVWFLYFMNQH